jgi:flagellar basal body rod protein FlgC
MFNHSVQGIQVNLDAFHRSAERLRNFEAADLAGETVAMTIAERAVTANTAVMRTSLSLTSEIIDILA